MAHLIYACYRYMLQNLIHTSAHILADLHQRTYSCTFTSAHIFLQIYINAHILADLHQRTYSCTFTSAHIFLQIYINAHILAAAQS